ncbi:MAG: hypothetical protein SOW08_02620 [Lachnospiraceae bacterium]|nr:hypothetical protein [Lachnospiraceae bacterium]
MTSLYDNKMTVVFIGFDGYSDLWDDCMDLYRRFWPDCPYRTLFVNNEKEAAFEGIDVIHAGADAEWSKKVQIAIERVHTPYICLLLEDFLVGDTINTRKVKNSLEFIEKHNIRYFKLVNMNRAVKNRDPHYGEYRFLHVIQQSDEYGVSLQAAVWSKEYLSELLGTDNYNAWTFEFNRVREAAGKPDIPNPGCVFDERNILNLHHGVIQGKYLPGTIKYFQRLGINLNVKREVMSRMQYYKLRLISRGKYMLPRSMRNPLKKILEKMGMKFVSTVRDK